MARRKEKAVFTAEAEQLRQIRLVVRSRRYRSASALIREAVDEKLARLRRERLSAQVERYCDEGLGGEDLGLVKIQAFGRKR
jgi:Arc/MetJ-type ribon-helix-helix transcriptional regulator